MNDNVTTIDRPKPIQLSEKDWARLASIGLVLASADARLVRAVMAIKEDISAAVAKKATLDRELSVTYGFDPGLNMQFDPEAGILYPPGCEPPKDSAERKEP